MLNESLHGHSTFRLYSLVLLVLLAGCANVEQRAIVSAQHQVVISGFEFVPAEIEVQAGDTITWVNRDVVPHNVIDTANQEAVTPDLAQGEKFSYKVRRAMSYKCGFHPSMKGGIVIP